MIDGQELEDREWDVMMEQMASEVGLILENVDDVDLPMAPPSGGVSNQPRQPSPQPDGQRGFSGGAGHSTKVNSTNQISDLRDLRCQIMKLWQTNLQLKQINQLI